MKKRKKKFDIREEYYVSLSPLCLFDSLLIYLETATTGEDGGRMGAQAN